MLFLLLIPDESYNIKHVLIHTQNQISCSSDPLSGLAGLLETCFASESTWCKSLLIFLLVLLAVLLISCLFCKIIISCIIQCVTSPLAKLIMAKEVTSCEELTHWKRP